jgi:DeoR/GlpR family transcriptional regulator of sugar metabolism
LINDDLNRVKMLKPERQRQIIQFIQDNSQATVLELSSLFKVSEVTIRRDLEELSEDGFIERAYGGAYKTGQFNSESGVRQRESEQLEIKVRIGHAAVELIKDGETVFITSGTTTLEVARALVGRRRVTVFTNALNISNALVEDSNITLVIIGGLLSRSELSMSGHITDQALADLQVDKVITGAYAINVQSGLRNQYLPDTLTDRAILRAAAKIIVVADHTKFNRVAAALIAPITIVNTIITDDGVPAGPLDELRALGIEIEVV